MHSLSLSGALLSPCPDFLLFVPSLHTDSDPTDSQPVTTNHQEEIQDEQKTELLDEFDPLANKPVTAEERKISESGLTDL